MVFVLAKRVMQGVVTVLGLTIVTFLLIRLLPGGPAASLLGPKATPEGIAALNQALGLDKPLYQQYGIWLGQLFHGDLGESYQQSTAVVTLLWQSIPPTILLVGSATLLSLCIAIPVATYQASRRDSLPDRSLSLLALVAYSTPVFWLGIVFILIFSIQLGWFPSGGLVSPGESMTNVASRVSHLVLPVTVLTITYVATWSRYIRSSVIDQLVQDFVRTAKAKGAPKRRALFVHALPNGLISTITLVGTSLPFILSGSLVAEVVFNYQGVGLLFWNAAQVSDFPILMAIILLLGIASVAGSIIADLANALIDPRIRVAS